MGVQETLNNANNLVRAKEAHDLAWVKERLQNTHNDLKQDALKMVIRNETERLTPLLFDEEEEIINRLPKVGGGL